MFDTAGNDVPTVLFEVRVIQVGAQPSLRLKDTRHHLINAFPVPTEAHGRDPKVGFPEPPILHIRVVAASFLDNPICISILAAHCTETNSHTRCGHRTITHKPAPGQIIGFTPLASFLIHSFLLIS